MYHTPFDRIKNSLRDILPFSVMNILPKKWEKIGAVLVLKIPARLQEYQEVIGKVYAKELGCRTALNDIGGVTGVYRTPVVEVIWGPSQTETMHRENGVRFLLDPQQVMLSSGNMAERKRMSTISNAGETVVDLFAGIGYFTIPMAVWSRPRRVFACEINPVAYGYLCKNIVLNHVTGVVEPRLGDNRETAPKGCADRVLVGYLEDSAGYLGVALECLRKEGGVIHYHGLETRDISVDELKAQVRTTASAFDFEVVGCQARTIKSYAPGVDHVVLDVRVGEG